MSIKDKQDIKLLNYCNSSVNIPTPNGDKILYGANADTGIPFSDYFNWRDIEYANNRSGVFVLGLIEPEDDCKKEFYESLKIFDWENKIWFYSDIVNTIKHPSLQSMQRIIAIDNIIVIDRIRGLMTGYINAGQGIDSRFIDVVNHRWEEINKSIHHSKIIVQAINESDNSKDEEVEAIKNQNAILMEQLEQMKKLIKSQSVQKTSECNVTGETKEEIKKINPVNNHNTQVAKNSNKVKGDKK